MSTELNAYWCRFFAVDGRPVPEAYDREAHESRFFVTGESADYDDNVNVTVCTLIHAPDTGAAWAAIRRCFPEASCDSMEAVMPTWRPGDRFPGLKPLTVEPTE